ncbi:MAG: hypothetical protein ACREPT_02840 [Rudaea sp.]
MNKPFRPLLVAEGGVPYLRSTTVDPLDAWMDLMEAVEALCPRWPQREVSVGRIFLL